MIALLKPMRMAFCLLLMFLWATANAGEPVLPSQGAAQFSPLFRKSIDVYFTAVAAYRKQDYATAQKLLRALWAEDRDTAAPEVRIRIAEENGLDGRALQAAETSEPVQRRTTSPSPRTAALPHSGQVSGKT